MFESFIFAGVKKWYKINFGIQVYQTPIIFACFLLS